MANSIMRVAVVAIFVSACSSTLPTDDVTGSVEQRVLTPSLSAYAFGANVQIGFTGMQQTTGDWIAIARTSEPTNTFRTWQWTNGAGSGNLTFSGLQPGTYVARAYYDWPAGAYNVMQTSTEFTVGESTGTPAVTPPPTVAINAAFSVAYANMPGNSSDWIAIAPAGSPSSVVSQFVYTNGATSGSAAFKDLPAGSYVARAFRCWACTSSYDLVASTSFTVTAGTGTATLTPPTSAVANAPFSVGFTNMAGYPSDWISIAPAGSPNNVFTKYSYTNGGTSGSTSFTGLGAGTWVARAFFNWQGTQSYTPQAQATFVISLPGTAASWRFDEGAGGVASDSSGNGNHGTVNGATWASGASCRSGACLSFDGINDSVGFPYSASLRFGTGAFTVAAWVRTSAGAGENIVVGTNRCGIGEAWLLSVVNGKAGFGTFGAGCSSTYLSSPASVDDGTWHLIVGRRNGTTQQVLVDGTVVASITIAATCNTDGAGTAPLIGNLSGCGGREFSGFIDSPQVFSRALSDAEVQGL